jgi:phosphopantothenoylcysteine decarboxylase/phosphopantothenate--cysteine ligase
MPRRPRPLRILITAGPTREYIDSVRYLSNDSSGRMGFEIATAAARRRHEVILVHGPVTLPAPDSVQAVPVTSAGQMLTASQRHWPDCDVLIAAAAVADYTPAEPSRFKIKKRQDSLVLRLRPTVDILAQLSAERRPGQLVVGFALEDRRARFHAEQKLRRKGLDAIVLNTPKAIGAARSQVQVLARGDEWRIWPERAKRRTAERIIRLVESLATQEVAAGDSAVRKRGGAGGSKGGRNR